MSLVVDFGSNYGIAGAAKKSGQMPPAPMPAALGPIEEVGAVLQRQGAIPAPKLTARRYLEHYSKPFCGLDEEKKTSICEYLRRVDKRELSRVLQEIGDLPADPGEDASNLDVIKFALRDFIAGKLDVFTMSAVFLHDACLNGDLNRDKVQWMPLFQEGKRNETAIEILKKGTIAADSSMYEYYHDGQIEELLKDPEVQEERIYVVPVPKGHNVVNVIADELQHPFLTVKGKGELHQVVLSPRLMQKLFHLKFKKQAPIINPVLGPSVAFKNFEKASQRDVLIPCRLFSHPKEADRRPASPLQFYHHDAAFHAYLLSNIPLEHRQAFIELASLFENKQDPSLHKFRFCLVDQDFRLYLHSSESDDATLLGFFKSSLARAWIECGGAGLQDILGHIQAHAETWAVKYRITFEGSEEDPYAWL